MSTDDPPDIQIAELTPGRFDQEELIRIAAGIGALMPKLSQRFPGGPIPMDVLTTIIDSPFHAQMVALHESQVVGSVNTSKVLEPAEATGQIGGLVVDERYRDHGVGRLLLGACVDWGRKQALSKLRLQTRPPRGVIPFYLKNGGVLVETSTIEFPVGAAEAN